MTLQHHEALTVRSFPGFAKKEANINFSYDITSSAETIFKVTA